MKNVQTRSFESAPPPRNVSSSNGFTLAEVLITLGIIGVVAALTMPALIGNYQKKEITTRLKKTYSIVQQAISFPSQLGFLFSLGYVSVTFFDKVTCFHIISSFCVCVWFL